MRHLFNLLTVLVLNSSICHADLITNGDFEFGSFASPGDSNFVTFAPGYVGTIVTPQSTLLDGWAVSLSSFDPDQVLSFGPPFGLEWTFGSLENDRWIDLNRGGDLWTLSQQIATTPGQQYRLSYDLLEGNVMGGASLQLSIVGTTTQGFLTTASDVGSPRWTTYSFLFTADSTAAVVALTSPSTGIDPWSGPQLDSLSITAVPEFASGWLLLVGVLLTATSRTRQNHAINPSRRSHL